MFWSHYSIGPLLCDFVDDTGLLALSCVNQHLYHEVKENIRIRKRQCIDRVMRFFHRPETFIFSLHRVFQEGYEKHLQRLFLMLPEWFAYLEEHQITYLDLDCPVYSCMTRPSHRFDPHIIEGIMGFLERNRTLLYCNLGLFYCQLSRRRIMEMMRAHPSLYHLEMTSVPDSELTSLYRHEDGRVEWRLSPPMGSHPPPHYEPN